MPSRKTWTRFALGFTVLLAGSLSAQQPATISVTGAVAQPMTLTAADLGALPRATASISGNGITTNYEGVWVSDLLKKAGVPMGSALRGASLSIDVVPSAASSH